MLKISGPIALATGLLLTAVLQHEQAGVGAVALWVIGLGIAGTGIGIAFPHLLVAAMESTDDPEEGGKAAAGLNTVELIAMAVGSAIGGVLVNHGAPPPSLPGCC